MKWPSIGDKLVARHDLIKVWPLLAGEVCTVSRIYSNLTDRVSVDVWLENGSIIYNVSYGMFDNVSILDSDDALLAAV